MPGQHVSESAFCSASLYGKQILIGGVYRAPNALSGHLDALYDYLFRHVKEGTHVILGGDFNVPTVDWHNGVVTENSSHAYQMLDIAHIYHTKLSTNIPVYMQIREISLI